ncbi:MAG: hypothetical protein HYS23_03835 [Geobacter sp.]|nr:hypothetical protein [Geobacter sp.]
MTSKFIFALISITLSSIAHAAVNPPNISPEDLSIQSHIQEEIPPHPTNHPPISPQCSGNSAVELTPKNILELWEELNLTSDQLGKIKGIYDRVNLETKKLDDAVNEKEKSLNSMLPGKPQDEKKLKGLVMEIATLNGELRFKRIKANLETAALLTPAQLEWFMGLRLEQRIPHPHVPHH